MAWFFKQQAVTWISAEQDLRCLITQLCLNDVINWFIEIHDQNVLLWNLIFHNMFYIQPVCVGLFSRSQSHAGIEIANKKSLRKYGRQCKDLSHYYAHVLA